MQGGEDLPEKIFTPKKNVFEIVWNCWT